MNHKTVFVTGSSRGIGKAIAIKFAKKGWRVAINCIKNHELLMNVKKEIEGYQVPCYAGVGDVGCYETAQALFQDAKKHLGSIDLLVNNAGISYIGLLTDMSPDDWNKVITTNLTSAFNCSSLVIPDMLAQKSGKIINISSVWGLIGASCEVAYSASKGGLNAFTKALAKELAPSNIQVNAIACGAIDTEMNQFMEDDVLINLINEIPSCRLGKAEEVANLVYQLTHNTEYLTGQIIQLDGGWV